MTESTSASLTVFFTQLQEGDRQAAAGLWEHFCPRLLGLARRVLDSRKPAVLDAEDAAQSAFTSFWKRAERGDFARDLDRNDLWRILATITVRKAKRHLARELAEKRGGGMVRGESEQGGEASDFQIDRIFAALPSREFDLACEELIQRLDSEELRTIALYKMMDYTNREIAELLDCTERKIERKLQVIRATWRTDADME